jgi:hypothetical protein
MFSFTVVNLPKRCRLFALTAMYTLIAMPCSLIAQGPVTAVFTHKENAVAATTYTGTGATGTPSSGFAGNTYTYQFGLGTAATDNTAIVDSLTAFGQNYHYQPANYFVKFRRVDNSSVVGLRKSLRIEQNGAAIAAGGTVALYPDYNDSLEQVFTQRIFNVAIDNLFQNTDNTNNINIERVDVVFPEGVNAIDNTRAGFAVFDWGDAGDHDAFYIAAIKTINADGTPASYFDPVAVAKTNYGSNVGGSATYVIMRKNEGETRLLYNHSPSTQTRDGVFLRMADLGVANNTAIYGYSLFSTDIVASPTVNLVDYTNATNFATTTDLSGGGIDLMAVAALWVTDTVSVILPDHISKLRATVMNDQVKLNWQLHNTTGLQTQVVERSGDGKKYTTLLNLPVAGEGAQTAIDTRPIDGKNYYRIKLLQEDGTVADYSTVATADLKAGNAIAMEVYPNPVKNNTLNLGIDGVSAGAYTIRLLDMQGRPVLRLPITAQQSIQQVLHLPNTVAAGTYVLQLADKAGRNVVERKIVVE